MADEYPAVPVTPYYADDLVTLFHGDAGVVIPRMGVASFDLLLTDPPYGINAAKTGKIGTSKAGMVTSYEPSEWDAQPVPQWLLSLTRSLCTHQIVWGGNFFEVPPSSCWLVWDKDNTGDFADCELAWTNLPKAVRMLTYRWNGMLQEPGYPKEKRVHPTQKPEAVMRWALGQAPKDVRTVFDPFAGSGTTLVACKRLGLKAWGIEREERYCEEACRRLAQGSLAEMFG